MELCCSFGLRIVTLESFEKFQCMINAKVRKMISKFKGFYILFPFIEEFYQENEFAIAATRLGFLSKPIWCYNNQPLNLSWFMTDDITSNTDEYAFNLFVRFLPTRRISAYYEKFADVACESV
jgi:hypothetical protein